MKTAGHESPVVFHFRAFEIAMHFTKCYDFFPNCLDRFTISKQFTKTSQKMLALILDEC